MEAKTPEDISDLLGPLYAEFFERDAWLQDRPLLAHYTAIETVEKIIRSSEIWLSNPLFMNDLEEMRFGLNTGLQLLMDFDFGSTGTVGRESASLLKHAFLDIFRTFEGSHALDIYIMCMSIHRRDDSDGILSMWRAYGANGNGAAVVFDTAALDLQSTSPLILSKVEYRTSEDRRRWIDDKIRSWCNALAGLILDTFAAYSASWHIFNLILIFSLTCKHKGFEEENEARLIYMADRDRLGKLSEYKSYAVNASGVQPKLKLPIKHIDGVTQSDMSLPNIVESIILGPSSSSPLAKASMVMMLEKLGRPELSSKVVTSSIPLRPL